MPAHGRTLDGPETSPRTPQSQLSLPAPPLARQGEGAGEEPEPFH